MSVLQGVVSSVHDTSQGIQTAVQNAETSTLLLLVTGIPAAGALAVYASDQLGLASMGGATANTMFQGATGIAGFATLIAVSQKLDGRDDIHFIEILPAVLATGISGVAFAYLLTPPSRLGNAWLEIARNGGFDVGSPSGAA